MLGDGQADGQVYRYLYRRTVIFLFIVLAMTTATHIASDASRIIVRRGNFAIAATVDGYLCYGTYVPRSVECKRAIPEPEITAATAMP